MLRRDFIGTVFGAAVAGQIVSGEEKSCPPQNTEVMKTAIDNPKEKIYIGDPLCSFTLVTKERITQEFANDESAVPVHEIIGKGETFGMAQADAWKQIRLFLMGLLLQNTIDFSDKEKSILYLDEFPVHFSVQITSQLHYVEVGYFVAVKSLS